MIDHPFDYDAATLEVVKSLTRAKHLVQVMDVQHRQLGASQNVRWSDEDAAELGRLLEVAVAKRSAYAENSA